MLEACLLFALPLLVLICLWGVLFPAPPARVRPDSFESYLPVQGRWLRYLATPLLLLSGLVLAMGMLSRSMERSPDAPVSAARTQIVVFREALALYALDKGQPPTTAQGLRALLPRPACVLPGKARFYLSEGRLPKDPWGTDYVYAAPGPFGEAYRITSYGADGRPGGTGFDADLTSEQVCCR